MRKLFQAALLAAFLSVTISGCYTKFEAPRPSYGERVEREDVDNYYDDDYFYGGYGNYPFYSYYGWQGPYLYAYPYYSFGYFYSPWWYDPWYYYYGDYYSTRLYQKAVRNRRIDDTIYNPPAYNPSPSPPYRPAGTVKDNTSGSSGTTGISKPTKTKSNSGTTKGSSGKVTRKRR
jgi:hypothetical protein